MHTRLADFRKLVSEHIEKYRARANGEELGLFTPGQIQEMETEDRRRMLEQRFSQSMVVEAKWLRKLQALYDAELLGTEDTPLSYRRVNSCVIGLVKGLEGLLIGLPDLTDNARQQLLETAASLRKQVEDLPVDPTLGVIKIEADPETLGAARDYKDSLFATTQAGQ